MAITDASRALSRALEHLRAGRMAEAESLSREVLAQQPYSSAAKQILGIIASQSGRADLAVEMLRAAAQLSPADPVVHCNLGVALTARRQFAAAAGVLQTALALRPDYPEALYNLGTALEQVGDYPGAEAAYRRALALNPQHAPSRANLGALLRALKRLDEALSELRTGLCFAPHDPFLHNNLGSALADAGFHAEALQGYRRAAELAPAHAGLASNVVYATLFDPQSDARAIREELARWDERHGTPAEPIRPHPNVPDPHRKLRVGYVSPDFREHVIGRNVRPLLTHHDRMKFEIICYSGVERDDAMTTEFRTLADAWRDTANAADVALADMIRDDGVDILVDLSQHLAHNRLPVFALRPAPVQVSFAGYPESAGMRAIGHRITDRFLESGRLRVGADASEAERLHFLDSFWCYDPCGAGLQPSTPPSHTVGHTTFCSLNNFGKLNERVLRLWARVLLSVNGSRLLLLSPEGSHRQRMLDLFAGCGISSGRVEFTGALQRPEYLALYHRADIALDPFPYNGHTTSLDALWMGVPVVTLAGEIPVSRAGLSELTNLGLADLIAHTEDDYVRIAAGLATDVPGRTALRATLRGRMEASVLMNAPRFTRQIETAYREIWTTWCTERLSGEI
jgi:protein O-GlcNAc transferase